MNVDPEYAAALFESGRQDAMQDQAERQFADELGERIADDTRAMLIERCISDPVVAAAFLDFNTEFGPTTRGQFVAMLERTGCQLWSDAVAEADAELREAMEAQ